MPALLQRNLITERIDAITRIPEDYRSPVMDALKVQIPIAILCLLMLDGGYMARMCAALLAGHWSGILLAMWRRPDAPTAGDLWYVRWGFLSFFAGLVVLQHFLN